MAETIKFNSEAGFLAKEIEIVITFRMLATEFVITKTPVTQPAPHEFFRPGFFFTKRTGTCDIGHDEKVIFANQK